MKRLAIVAAFGVIALAPLGLEQHFSGASGAPRRVAAPRRADTSVDLARRSLPLPRTTAVAPRDEDQVRDARVSEARADAGRAARSAPPVSRAWAALAACESGGNPRARSADGRYFGAFQFSVETWRSLGYGGNPADHPYSVQLQAAQRLQARSGWDQWPRCSRRLGLR